MILVLVSLINKQASKEVCYWHGTGVILVLYLRDTGAILACSDCSIYRKLLSLWNQHSNVNLKFPLSGFRSQYFRVATGFYLKDNFKCHQLIIILIRDIIIICGMLFLYIIFTHDDNGCAMTIMLL